MGKSAGSKAGGGSGGGGKGKSIGGGNSSQNSTQEESRKIELNAVTSELSRGGTLQNTKYNFTDEDERPSGFQFGKETTLKGFAVDRRDPNINEINRSLRQQEFRVKIYDKPGTGRTKLIDSTGYPVYVEFL